MNGYILYRGPSKLNPEKNIVAIATGFNSRSKNSKTGDMIQTYILSDDQTPLDAANSGEDQAICGNCVHRKENKGTCYVVLMHGPTSVYRAYQRGSYGNSVVSPSKMRELGKDKIVRLGAYGDPAALPISVWHNLLKYAKRWTGYTHQWKSNPHLKRSHLKRYCMASVDSEEEYQEAKLRGWRTYRVLRPTEKTVTKEIHCPASDEMGKRTTCEKCTLCMGTSVKAKDIAIYAHGRSKNNFK